MLTFLRIFMAMFIAEMGDKTQLLMIAMTSRYKMKDIIIGSGASILVLNAMAVVLGSFISSLIPQHIVKLVAGVAFLYFSWSSLFKNKDEDNGVGSGSVLKNPILIIFWTFFIAEFGDKTQLSAITFAAEAGINEALIVCLSCSLGLFSADFIGMILGDVIKKHTGTHFMDRMAFLLFFIFGLLTMREALSLFGFSNTFFLVLAMAAVATVFLLICILTHRRKSKNVKKSDTPD